MNLGTEFSEYYYYSLGATFHLNKVKSKSRFTPFTGILVGSDYDYTRLGFVQIPIGVSYIILRLLEFAFQNSSIATVIPLSFLHFTIEAV